MLSKIEFSKQMMVIAISLVFSLAYEIAFLFTLFEIKLHIVPDLWMLLVFGILTGYLLGLGFGLIYFRFGSFRWKFLNILLGYWIGFSPFASAGTVCFSPDRMWYADPFYWSWRIPHIIVSFGIFAFFLNRKNT